MSYLIHNLRIIKHFLSFNDQNFALTFGGPHAGRVFETPELDSIAGVGNYFRSRATLRLYTCLAGQISVKNANFKLKISLGGQDVAPDLL
jgi:hypothetical protein